MNLATRFASRLTLGAAALLIAGTALAATKLPPVRVPIGQGAAVTSIRIGPAAARSTCTLGVTDPAAYIIDYIYPPADAYYTLLDPASCTACNTPAVSVTTAHVYLNFPAPCTQLVSVGIYGALGDATCYSPDPNTVLCPPFTAALSPTVAGNYNFSIAIPGGCCVSGPAFLKIEFMPFGAGCNTSTTWPRLITTADCSLSCMSWNIYPGGGPDDLCTDIGFPGYPVMNVEADCCASTPTRHHSWGNLKGIYR